MTITAERKDALIKEHGRGEGDTGSPEVQVSILTERIANLTEHFKGHHKDNHSRRGLLGLVQKRRRLKNYLAKTNPEAFKKITEELEGIKSAEKAAKAEKAAPKAEKKAKTEKAAPKAEKKAPAKKTAKKK